MPLEALKTLFSTILQQTGLVGSWALAVIGGCAAIIVWYVRLPEEPELQIRLRWVPLLLYAIVAEGISLLLMVLGYGQLITTTLVVELKKLGSAQQMLILLKHAGFPHLQELFAAQFASFFLGVAILVAFGLRNYSLLNKKAHAVRSRPLSHSQRNVT